MKESMEDKWVLKVEGISKKFASNLKTSMRYGFRDFFNASFGMNLKPGTLRADEFWAVKDASFELKKGDRLGVLGLNGAGKTTLMKVLSGIYRADEGRFHSKGKVMPLFAFTTGMNPLFSGRENVYLKGAVFGMSRDSLEERMDQIIAFADLEEHIDAPFGTYSSGMKARLAFSVAVHADFDILIIDEGLAVGDLGFRTKAYKKLDELSDSIATISVAHNPNILARVSNRILVMDHGHIIHSSKDVGKAIDFYYDHYLDQSKLEGVKTSESKVGSIIQSVKINAERSEGVLSIKHGSSLVVEIEINTDKLPDKAQAVVHFHTSDKEPLGIAESKLSDFFIEKGQGVITIKASFQSIQFKPGVYNIHVAVNRGEHFEIYEKLNFVEQLQVVGDYRSHAPVQLLASWKDL